MIDDCNHDMRGVDLNDQFYLQYRLDHWMYQRNGGNKIFCGSLLWMEQMHI